MSTASIVLQSDGDSIAVVRIENRGSRASIETDLSAAFGAMASIPADGGRVAALICAHYEGQVSTVDPVLAVRPDHSDDSLVLLDLDTPDSEGRPTGSVLEPVSGDLSPLTYD